MSEEITITELAPKAIRLDGGTQPREQIDEATVAEYAADIAAGAVFPPVDVFYDGKSYWLADGFHRHSGHVKAGSKWIAARVHQGSQRDAILFSVGANAGHGIRRTNADKRRAASRLLSDKEWSQWSDSEIAKRCAVSQRFVGELRSSLRTVHSEESPRTYTTKHGTTATMNTGKIGKGKSFSQLVDEGLAAAEKAEPEDTTEVEAPWDPLVEKVMRRLNAIRAEAKGLAADLGRQSVRGEPDFTQPYTFYITPKHIEVFYEACDAMQRALPAAPSDKHPGYRCDADVRADAKAAEFKRGRLRLHRECETERCAPLNRQARA